MDYVCAPTTNHCFQPFKRDAKITGVYLIGNVFKMFSYIREASVVIWHIGTTFNTNHCTGTTPKADQFCKATRLYFNYFKVSPFSFIFIKRERYYIIYKCVYTVCVFLVETGQIDPILIERYNTPGFVGCLSRVQFNSVAPLKAALRSGLAARVSTHGILVPSNCGASPLTISPMASASDPWHLEAGRDTHR